MPCHSRVAHLRRVRRTALSVWYRQPELILHQLTGLQTWPFPNAQGALSHFLLLISALPLETHQQLCNVGFILRYVLALQVFVGGGWGDWRTVLSLISELSLHPEFPSLENHLRRVPTASQRALPIVTYASLRLDSVSCLIRDCLPWFHHL